MPLTPVMAAFGRIADIEACLLYPQKRTLELNRAMSALCQKRTYAMQQKTSLFDHLVGAQQDRGRQFDTKRSSSPEVDDELEV